MPQTNQFLPAKNPSNVNAPLQLDASGNLLIGNGSTRVFLTGPAVVKATPGRICKIIVVTGTGALMVNDCATTGAATVANAILDLTTTAVGTIYSLDFPCLTGIVISVASGNIAVSFD